jgi:hypothetical protein
MKDASSVVTNPEDKERDEDDDVEEEEEGDKTDNDSVKPSESQLIPTYSTSDDYAHEYTRPSSISQLRMTLSRDSEDEIRQRILKGEYVIRAPRLVKNPSEVGMIRIHDSTSDDSNHPQNQHPQLLKENVVSPDKRKKSGFLKEERITNVQRQLLLESFSDDVLTEERIKGSQSTNLTSRGTFSSSFDEELSHRPLPEVPISQRFSDEVLPMIDDSYEPVISFKLGQQVIEDPAMKAEERILHNGREEEGKTSSATPPATDTIDSYETAALLARKRKSEKNLKRAQLHSTMSRSFMIRHPPIPSVHHHPGLHRQQTSLDDEMLNLWRPTSQPEISTRSQVQLVPRYHSSSAIPTTTPSEDVLFGLPYHPGFQVRTTILCLNFFYFLFLFSYSLLIVCLFVSCL